MTREEQISEASNHVGSSSDHPFLAIEDAAKKEGFVLGAHWADSHPCWHKPNDLPSKSGRYLVVHTECPGEVMEGKFLCNSNCWQIEGCYNKAIN